MYFYRDKRFMMRKTYDTLNTTTLPAIAQILLPFVISPGASVALTLSATAARLPRAALKVWAGTAAGLWLLAFTNALGVARLVLQ